MRALPKTWSSQNGEAFVGWLYRVVKLIGYVRVVRRDGVIVGVISGIGKWILTLAVEPTWQRRGIGRELLVGTPGRRYVYTEEDTVGFYQKMGFVRIFKLGSLIFLCRN